MLNAKQGLIVQVAGRQVKTFRDELRANREENIKLDGKRGSLGEL